jgi:hypothetical protein
MVKEAQTFSSDLRLLFINFKQVYDTVHRKYCDETLRTYRIHTKLVYDRQHIKKNFNLNFKCELTGL